MNNLEFGAEQAVKKCVKIKQGEKVVIITDTACKKIGDTIYNVANKVSPGKIKLFVLEDFGERPDDGTNPLHFPKEIGLAMTQADVSFYSAQSKKGELPTLRTPMLDIIKNNKHLRHAHMPNISEELMTMGMCVDYDKVQELSKKVYDIVKGAKEIRVTTPRGTDILAEFSPKLKWKICDGQIDTPGDWTNLPDGEVFTCVSNVPKARIVIDGVLGDHFGKKYGLLEETPLILDIENSRIKSINCDNVELLKEFTEYTKTDENANRVGEFAIGTNIGLTHLVGNLLQDEKFPGIHIAIGHGYPEITGSTWNSDAHCDAVLKNCTIIIDGETIMKDGKFLI